MVGMAEDRCLICGRALSQEQDPLSDDCGGDCWGCIGDIEAKMGHQPSVDAVNDEIKEGLRNADGSPKA